MSCVARVLVCGIAAAVLLCSDVSVRAANLFQLDDFQDGTTQSWEGAAPVNVADGGPMGTGDAYLNITSSGTNGPGSRLTTKNESAARTGDYLAAGAQRIAVDIRNSNASSLEFRAVLVSSGNDRWTSTTAALLPADAQWHSYEFSLLESQLTSVAGAAAYGDVIQDVARLLIRQDADEPSASGQPIAASLDLDNIQLLPGGDFDNNGLLEIADVDSLVAAIAAGGNPTGFDLDGDGAVDQSDLNEWLRLGGNLNLGPGRSYLPGDANLDGVVDGVDFIAWNGSKFTADARWSAGDFDATGTVDGLDFIVWNGQKFTSADVISVPEPSGFPIAWVVIVSPMCLRYRSIVPPRC